MSEGVVAAPVEAPAEAPPQADATEAKQATKTDKTTKPVEAKAKAPEPEPTEEYEIDGKKYALTKTQARAWIQKAAAADKRIQEATEKQKKLDTLLKELETDTEAALSKLGKDPQKIFGAMFERQARLELMTPEQKERHALEQERDRYKKEVEAAQQERERAKNEELERRHFTALEQQLLGAAKANNLDQTPETLELMCDIALESVELGYPITPNQVAQEVLFRQSEHIKARDAKILAKLTDDKKLMEYLGPGVVKRIQKASLAAAPTPTPKPKTTKLPPRSESGTFIKETEFDKKFGFRR